MDNLPLFYIISISGAQLLARLYDIKSIGPKGLFEVMIFNLNVVANEFRLAYADQFDKDDLDQMVMDSYRILMKELTSYMPDSAIESFLNDRSKIYINELKNINKDYNPIRWDAVHYLFYTNPLGEYPSPFDLLKSSNYFELVLFGEAMLQEFRFLRESIKELQL